MADELGDDWWKHSKEINTEKKKKRKLESNKDVEANNKKKLKLEERKRSVYPGSDDDDDDDNDDGDTGGCAGNNVESSTNNNNLIINDGDVESTDKKIKKRKFEKRVKHSKKVKKGVCNVDGDRGWCVEDFIQIVKDHHSNMLTNVERMQIQLLPGDFSISNDQSHTPVSFLKTLVPKWKRLLKTNAGRSGSPVVIIVCSSAIRCVEFIKQINELKNDKCIIAKLFAKHLKLDKTQDFLRSKVIHVAVGTPNRLTTLISCGDLKLDHVKHFILDVSHRDVKKMNMMQIKIVKSDLMVLLTKHVIPCLKNLNNCDGGDDDGGGGGGGVGGRCRIALF